MRHKVSELEESDPRVPKIAAESVQTLTPLQIAQMKEIWAMIDPVQCKGLCDNSCGNVPIHPVEAFHIIQQHGGQIAVQEHPVYAPKENRIAWPTLGATGVCQFLQAGRCSIYADRPLVCRAFGHPLLTLQCEHGCAPKKSRLTTDSLAYYMSALLSITSARGRKAAGSFSEFMRDKSVGGDLYAETVAELVIEVLTETAPEDCYTPSADSTASAE